MISSTDIFAEFWSTVHFLNLKFRVYLNPNVVARLATLFSYHISGTLRNKIDYPKMGPVLPGPGTVSGVAFTFQGLGFTRGPSGSKYPI